MKSFHFSLVSSHMRDSLGNMERVIAFLSARIGTDFSLLFLWDSQEEFLISILFPSMRGIAMVQRIMSLWGGMGTGRLWLGCLWARCPSSVSSPNVCTQASVFRRRSRHHISFWQCLELVVFPSCPRAVPFTWPSGSVSCSTSSSGECPSYPRSQLLVSSSPPVSLLCLCSLTGEAVWLCAAKCTVTTDICCSNCCPWFWDIPCC